MNLQISPHFFRTGIATALAINFIALLVSTTIAVETSRPTLPTPDFALWTSGQMIYGKTIPLLR